MKNGGFRKGLVDMFSIDALLHVRVLLIVQKNGMKIRPRGCLKCVV